MNKLVTGFCIVIILLSAVCGVLYYQIGDLENQTSVLEGQMGEYQNQTGQLENQINELEAQNLELQNQTRALETKLGKVANASKVRIADILLNITQHSSLPPHTEGILTVTVKNFGTNDVDGLSLWMKNTFRGDEYFAKRTLGTLKGGEAQNITVFVEDMVIYCRTTLMLDDMILDELFTPPY